MSERPMLAGFHHITLVAADPERSGAFYTGVLGLSRLPLPERPARVELLRFGDGSSGSAAFIELRSGAGESRGRSGIGGIHHYALGTGREDSLLRWKRRLTDLGVPVSGPYDRGYFTSIYFRDPDGHVVEIATAGPGYTIDEPPDALGSGVMIPPARIIAGIRDEVEIAALTHPDPVPGITSDMRLAALHHISGITDDLQRAGDFYQCALGLRLIKRTVNRDDPNTPHWFWAGYDGQHVSPNSSFTLFGWPPGWNRARAGIGQLDIVSFRAGDEEDLLAWRDHLRGMDREVVDVRRGGELMSIRFRAPDETPLEISRDHPLDPHL